MKKNVLSLIVSSFLMLMVVSVASAAESVTMPLHTGNSLVSPAFKSILTAAMLCRNYPSIYSISKQRTSGVLEYQEYICNSSRLRDSFTLNPKVGYFIRANAPFDLTFSGKRVTDNFNYTVAEGWNLIGIPNADQHSFKAEGLCGNFGNTNLKVVEVSRYRNGGWDSHLCSETHGTPVDMNNFDILQGEGYAIKLVK